MPPDVAVAATGIKRSRSRPLVDNGVTDGLLVKDDTDDVILINRCGRHDLFTVSPHVHRGGVDGLRGQDGLPVSDGLMVHQVHKAIVQFLGLDLGVDELEEKVIQVDLLVVVGGVAHDGLALYVLMENQRALGQHLADVFDSGVDKPGKIREVVGGVHRGRSQSLAAVGVILCDEMDNVAVSHRDFACDVVGQGCPGLLLMYLLDLVIDVGHETADKPAKLLRPAESGVKLVLEDGDATLVGVAAVKVGLEYLRAHLFQLVHGGAACRKTVIIFPRGVNVVDFADMVAVADTVRLKTCKLAVIGADGKDGLTEDLADGVKHGVVTACKPGLGDADKAVHGERCRIRLPGGLVNDLVKQGGSLVKT